MGLVTPEILPYRREGEDGVIRYVAKVCPDYVIVFPTWFPRLTARTDMLEPLYRVRAEARGGLRRAGNGRISAEAAVRYDRFMRRATIFALSLSVLVAALPQPGRARSSLHRRAWPEQLRRWPRERPRALPCRRGAPGVPQPPRRRGAVERRGRHGPSERHDADQVHPGAAHHGGRQDQRGRHLAAAPRHGRRPHDDQPARAGGGRGVDHQAGRAPARSPASPAPTRSATSWSTRWRWARPGSARMPVGSYELAGTGTGEACWGVTSSTSSR